MRRRDALVARVLPCRLARPLIAIGNLHFRQIVSRVESHAHRAAVRVAGTRAHERLVEELRAAHFPADGRHRSRWLALARWRLAHPPGAATRDGRFTFLSQEIALGMPPRWDRDATQSEAHDPALWHFNLHYFDWLWDLLADGHDDAALAAMEDWAERCFLGARDCFAGPWSPYTISLRVPNWLAALTLIESRGGVGPVRAARLLDSVRLQLLCLSRRFEYEHGANQLLENAKCLLMGSLFFRAPRWREQAWRELRAQLAEQILPDGCHFERSPGYHALLLDRLMDLLTLRPELRAIRSSAERMLSFARHVACPDGSLPLLGDTAHGQAPSLTVLRDRAGILGLRTGETDTRQRDGHYVLRGSGGDWLLFDAAPSGPDSSGAHQHADLLGFELWIGGVPVVVDGGAGHYGEGPLREALRSAPEHAVPEVDGEGPADPWKSFRLGRRGHPFAVRERSLGPHKVLLEARHDGFSHRGVEVRRRVLADVGQRLFRVEDRLTGRFRHVVVRLPLHPGIAVEPQGGAQALLLHDGRPLAVLRAFTNGARALIGEEKGWRWERFGFRVPRIVLRVEAHGPGPTTIALEIRALRPKGPGF